MTIVVLSDVAKRSLSGSKIVQAWRATGWWPDHYSIAIFDIKKVPGGLAP
jgi:hypothetical protein